MLTPPETATSSRMSACSCESAPRQGVRCKEGELLRARGPAAPQRVITSTTIAKASAAPEKDTSLTSLTPS